MIKNGAHPDAYVETRPWGNFCTITSGNKYQIKKITVNPEGVLSLQKHEKRCEHWVVVEGEAVVTLNEQTMQLTEGSGVFIDNNDVHRLENKTQKPLILIEIQYGSYLGEDDIVRLEDIYDRC